MHRIHFPKQGHVSFVVARVDCKALVGKRPGRGLLAVPQRLKADGHAPGEYREPSGKRQLISGFTKTGLYGKYQVPHGPKFRSS